LLFIPKGSGDIDKETLTFLLRGGHLNMPDRISRGAWPHPPLKFDDLVQHLVSILKTERWFPRAWEPAKPGEIVWEGGVIERVSSSKYIYHAQRGQPTNPFVLAESTEQQFSSAEAVARHYLKWDLNLPGDLDGWKVI
jgi:hypothetical protein